MQKLSKYSIQIYRHFPFYLSLVPQKHKANGLDMKFNAEEEDVADIHFRLHPSDCIWAEFREDFV